MASKKEAKPEVQQPKEATYSIDELVQAAGTFQTNTIVVRAALTKAGKTSYTMREARQYIERMKNKEVKE